MNYSYNYSPSGGAGVVFSLFWLALVVLVVIGLWKTLTKAGLPGWAAIIPFYNEYNIVKMSNRPISWFWIILACSLFVWIPLIGFLLFIALFVLWVMIALDIAKNFGQGTGFSVLLILFPSIMFLILGFGNYQFSRVADGSTGGYAQPMAPPPAPPAGQYVPPTPGSVGQPMAPPPPLAQPVMPQPLAPPPSQAAPPVTPPVQAAPYSTPPATEAAAPTTPPAETATPTPPPPEPAPPESPTPPPPPPAT